MRTEKKKKNIPMATFHIMVVPSRANTIDDESPDGLDGGEAAGRRRRHDGRARRGKERETEREVRRMAWGGREDEEEEEVVAQTRQLVREAL